MRVISNEALVAFAEEHPTAAEPLPSWRKTLESGTFAHFAELTYSFNTVDRVGQFYVFDIGGNKFRVIAAIHFDRQILFVRHVFTYKDYDAWKP